MLLEIVTYDIPGNISGLQDTWHTTCLPPQQPVTGLCNQFFGFWWSHNWELL